MQSRNKTDIRLILEKTASALLALLVIRVVFLVTNVPLFAGRNIIDIVLSIIYGSRLDMAVLIPVNCIFVLGALIAPAVFARRRKLFFTAAGILNGLIILLAICDNMYFAYTQHRMSYGVLYLIPQSFTPQLILTYLVKGWYWILFIIVFLVAYHKIFSREQTIVKRYSLKQKLLGVLLLCVACYSAARGYEARPLSPSTALLHFPPKFVSLASNTGFNLLYSLYKGQKELEDPAYFGADYLDKQFPIIHHNNGFVVGNKPNIVLFVMESFARDFLDPQSKFKASTPFLDSLMNHSLVFTNAFSNGNESTHGLVSVLASLPPFTQVPYYHSQYHGVDIRGIGSMLSAVHYDCSFFLGDNDDSFGFREFTHSLGISNYYSREDFGNDSFYNGAWGIHDDRFFRFSADVLSTKKTPFFATIFNVSSHPPYIIPEDLKNQFTIPRQNAAQNSVSYVDFAYRRFFEKATKALWFRNTIFIFIADHFLSPSDDKVLSSVNMNEIPFFIFSPSGSPAAGRKTLLVQQLDVVPTILELTGYKGSFMSFGRSVFDSSAKRYAVQRTGELFQILDSAYALGFNKAAGETMYLFNYRQDPELKENLIENPAAKEKKKELETALKARIQRYNISFLRNKFRE